LNRARRRLGKHSVLPNTSVLPRFAVADRGGAFDSLPVAGIVSTTPSGSAAVTPRTLSNQFQFHRSTRARPNGSARPAAMNFRLAVYHRAATHPPTPHRHQEVRWTLLLHSHHITISISLSGSCVHALFFFTPQTTSVPLAGLLVLPPFTWSLSLLVVRIETAAVNEDMRAFYVVEKKKKAECDRRRFLRFYTV